MANENIPKGKVVYFIEAVGTGLVKIGKTENLKGRIRNLQSGSAAALRLLHAFPGYSEEEEDLHHRFRAHRVQGEWFRLDVIQGAIEALRSPGDPTLD